MNNKKQQLDTLLEQGKISKTESLYYVNDREILLVKNADKVTESLIEKYIKSILPVLTYFDPYLKYQADEVLSRKLLRTENRQYSEELRKSVFETLLILKNNSDSFKNCSNKYIERRIEQTIAKLLEDNTKEWRFWCTNNEYLPMIALIAPDAYIKSIEEVLKDKVLLGKIRDAILNPKWLENDWLKNIRYSLKLLAYFEDYFARSIKTLINLMKYDQDGTRNENRCCNTIVDIINPNRPNTFYPSKNIPDVILSLLEKNKTNKRKILKELLPHRRNTFYSFELPKWMPQRNRANEISSNNNIDANYFIAFKKYVSSFINDSISFEKTLELIKELPYLFDSFISNDPEIISSIKRVLICNSLQNKLNNREQRLIWEELVKTRAKVPEKFFEICDVAINIYEPNNIVAKCLLYFDNDTYELIGRYTKDYEDKEQELHNNAILIIEEVYKEKGVNGIFTIAKDAKYPIKLASIVSQTTFKNAVLDHISKIIQLKTDSNTEEFINAIIYTNSCEESLEELLVKLRYDEQNEPEKLKIALSVKPKKEIWDIIQGKNETEYWTKIKLNRRYDWTLEEYEHCITKLNSVKRQRDSINIAATALYKKINLSNELLFNLLENLSNTAKQPLNTRESQDIEEIILHLQKHNDNLRMAMIELKYITIFEKWRKDLYPSNLIRIIGIEPRFFCEICDQMYNGNGNYQLYRILHDFHIKPGLNQKGTVTKQSLTSWLKIIENHYSNDKEKLKLVHSIIGQNLAPLKCDSPVDDKTILNFLENNKQDDYYNGFLIGIANSRGVVHVDKEHIEEKRLNKIWLEAAKSIEKSGFINVAGLYRKVAEMFMEDARRIDNEHTIRNAGTI